MKLDFNKTLVGPSGEETPQHLGDLLATLLFNDNKGDASKLVPWGINLKAKKPIDLDKPDQKILREFIEKSETISNLGKFRMLEVLDQEEPLIAEEEESPKTKLKANK